MSAAKADNFPPISEHTVTRPERSEKKQKPTPPQPPEPERKPRRIARRDNVNRAYYVAAVDASGRIVKFISKFPTIGQARKNRELVCNAACVDPIVSRIVRTVIVE